MSFAALKYPQSCVGMQNKNHELTQKQRVNKKPRRYFNQIKLPTPKSEKRATNTFRTRFPPGYPVSEARKIDTASFFRSTPQSRKNLFSIKLPFSSTKSPAFFVAQGSGPSWINMDGDLWEKATLGGWILVASRLPDLPRYFSDGGSLKSGEISPEAWKRGAIFVQERLFSYLEKIRKKGHVLVISV